ncbi:diadenosine tetraphosphate hydrolase [Lysinibacillus sphaericus]|nr:MULTISPECIES: diadenosine tetraphosphate hydrolase [Lysinibacillus]MBE5083264.1 diadenosine tetraphosphate hydrolase [Bacillus thuringiensis]AMO33690.1 diadenosine tetraphosphate hydrolase [Lysinibacillus sphaericus]AMR91202.1 diadenosine tetraphosphate hydrolase [Lysinibacillus sphaericus]ANA45251.1 diadenosine tetraphosphate hydrolase [Lysinibacillus sphaericus]KZL44714.1 diadenosine tetraphosphate hydrolase [Lysinibacillus sphaericus]
MRNIVLSSGENVYVDCLSCAIISGQIEPNGGVLIETDYFHAHQDIAYPIKGLVIVASKRHIHCLDELNNDEKLDYIHLLTKIRQAQREVLGIAYVYYFYNEDTTHHFHIWMVPRYEWMNAFGRSVESLRPVLLHARKNMNNEEHEKEVREAIKLLRDSIKNRSL